MSQKTANKKTETKSASTTYQTRKPQKPFLCENFVSQKLTFTELDMDNERCKAQGIAYPNYGDGKFIFQTPEFKITQYGIPSLGDYYKDDKDRCFFKFPLDPSQAGCVTLEKMFSEIDKYMIKNQPTILGKYAKVFKYKPIVKEPAPDEDLSEIVEETETDKKKSKAGKSSVEKKEKMRFWRAKMDLSYPDCEILTKVYVKGESTPVNVTTATEMNKYVPWGSSVRCIIMMNKLWAEKTKKNKEAKFREYGLVMKVMQMESTPRENAGNMRDAFSEYAFFDGTTQEGESDETNNNGQVSDNNEKEDDNEKVEGTTNEELDGEDGEAEAEEDDVVGGEAEEDEEEAEDDEEDDPEPEPEPPKKTSGKKAAPAVKQQVKGKK